MRSLTIIKLSNIYKKHQHPVLENISLEINQGEFISITGPSGCGKSTLIQIIGILEPASKGTYLLDNQDIFKMTLAQRALMRNKYIGFVFQRYHLIKHLSVVENIMLPLQYGEHNVGIDKVLSLLKAFNLSQYAEYNPHQLSYGQQQRVAIIRSIITDPPVILADEPTGSLDQENAEIVMNALRDLQKNGKTIIFITHNTDLIQHSDKHYQLSNHQLELTK